MVKLQEEVVDILIKVAKSNNVIYNEVKSVYISLFYFLLTHIHKEVFAQIKLFFLASKEK
jgi:hypothetical protein